MADRDIVYRYGYEGLDQLAAKVTETGDKAEAAHKKILGSSKEAGGGLEALNVIGERAKEKMHEMSGELGVAGSALAALGPVGLGVATILATVTLGLSELVKAAGENEVSVARFNAVLSATGQASGKTVEQLNGLAESLATTTLATKDQIEAASSQLLTFGSVSGDVFDRTMTLAQDLAATGFGSIADNAVKLGRVLEQPTENLDALRRVGIQFNIETKDRIELLEKEGKHFEAQQVILDEIAKKVGGSGAAQGDTLMGAWHAFGQQFTITLENVGARLGILGDLKAGIQGITGALKVLGDSEVNRAIAELDHLATTAGYLTSRDKERMEQLRALIATEQLAASVDEELGQRHRIEAENSAAVDKMVSDSRKETAKAADDFAKESIENATEELAASKRLWEAADAEEKKRQDLISALTIEADAKQRVTDATMLGRDALDAMNLELEIEANLRKLGNDASPAEIQAVVDKTAATSAATIALRNYNEELEKQKQAEEKAQREAEKAAKAIQRQLEDQAKAVQKFAQDAGTQIVDAFINMAEGAKKPFDGLLNYAKRIFEQMVAAALLNPIIVPVVASMVGGIGGLGGGTGAGGALSAASGLVSLGGSAGIFGAGGLGAANLIDTLGYNYLGIGGTVSSSGIMGGASPFLSSYLGYGAIGALGGGLLADVLGLNKTGGSIGGGIGSAIGTIGGPIGTVVGGLLGSLLGGLFGPGPSDKLEGSWFNVDSGKTTPYGYTGAKYSAENAAASDKLANSLIQFAQTLGQYGLNVPDPGNARVEYGNRGAPVRAWYGGLNGDQGAVYQNSQDAFKAIAEQMLHSLTNVPAEFQKAIDNIDWSNLDDFAKQLNDAASAIAEMANFTSAMQVVRDQIKQIKDPQQYELDQLDRQFQPLLDEARKLGQSTADIEELEGLKRAAIIKKYAVQITTDIQQPVAAVAQAVGDWSSMVGALYDQQINAVQAQIDAAHELEGVWGNIRAGLQQAQNGLLVDSNLSPLSLEQRTGEAKRQFDDAFQKAMGGDAGAAAQLGDLARAFLTADMAFQHGNAQYAADFESIMGKLGQAQQYAGQQVTIEQLQLNALNGILAALTAGRGAATGAGAKPAGYNAADGAALTQAYGAAQAASGLSEADFLASPGGSVWVQARDNLIGGTTDPNLLYQDLAAARAQKGQEGMSSIGASYEAKVIAQLGSLGIAIPKYDTGGYVNRTGLAMVHQNEYVLRPGEAAGINETLAALKAEIMAMRQVLTEYATRDLQASAQLCENTRAAADAPADALVLAATSARTRTVG
mgnify:CR=1 FL=1